jgi:hypothetical protein
MRDWIEIAMFFLPWCWYVVSDQLHDPIALPPSKEPPIPRTHWIAGWLGPKSGLDSLKIELFTWKIYMSVGCTCTEDMPYLTFVTINY